MAGPPPYPGMPRWVKVLAIVAGVVALLALLLVAGGHGPRDHAPPSEYGMEQP